MQWLQHVLQSFGRTFAQWQVQEDALRWSSWESQHYIYTVHIHMRRDVDCDSRDFQGRCFFWGVPQVNLHLYSAIAVCDWDTFDTPNMGNVFFFRHLFPTEIHRLRHPFFGYQLVFRIGCVSNSLVPSNFRDFRDLVKILRRKSGSTHPKKMKTEKNNTGWLEGWNIHL